MEMVPGTGTTAIDEPAGFPFGAKLRGVCPLCCLAHVSSARGAAREIHPAIFPRPLHQFPAIFELTSNAA